MKPNLCIKQNEKKSDRNNTVLIFQAIPKGYATEI